MSKYSYEIKLHYTNGEQETYSYNSLEKAEDKYQRIVDSYKYGCGYAYITFDKEDWYNRSSEEIASESWNYVDEDEYDEDEL